MANFDFLFPFCGEIDIDGADNKTFSFKDGEAVFNDINIVLNRQNGDVDLNVVSSSSLISHVYLFYKISHSQSEKVFGDSLERGYADMFWGSADSKRQMFWYFFFLDEEKKLLRCFGVKVQPRSIVSFKIIDDVLKVDVNTQSGGSGVFLENRKLNAATFVYEEYFYTDLFVSIKTFLNKLMSGKDIKKPNTKIYGFNNWYYAYGNSSYEQILKDTLLLKKLTKDLNNRPYMVIDDGWSIHDTSGPWYPNSKFGDMKSLADEIKTHNIKPGIWFRPLKDLSDNLKDYRHPLNASLYDLSSKKVLEQIENDVLRFVKWGYELIKFDFVTVDLYLNYGFQMDENLCQQGWKYKDNHFTNAEMLLNLYNIIRKAAPKAILIGCNAISHLCAGIVELNRIGDDTSGIEWERTLNYGVNSLAFRLMQNNVFYVADGDCVGITGKIDWKQNKEWLKLLSQSGSPLFVSVDPECCDDEIEKDLIKAFTINSEQNDKCFPIDWINNKLPNKWNINEKVETFDWNII